MNLFEFTSSFQDRRRGQGQRHRLHDVLVIVIMAIISGQQGIKGFARFAKQNEEELTDIMKLKHGVPKFNTIRSVLESLEEQELSSKFLAWVKEHHAEWADDFIAIDGKAIRSTLSNAGTSHQHLISVVSAYGQKSKMVYGMVSNDSKGTKEAVSARELMVQMGCDSKTFTLDALHTQKKL